MVFMVGACDGGWRIGCEAGFRAVVLVLVLALVIRNE